MKMYENKRLQKWKQLWNAQLPWGLENLITSATEDLHYRYFDKSLSQGCHYKCAFGITSQSSEKVVEKTTVEDLNRMNASWRLGWPSWSRGKGWCPDALIREGAERTCWIWGPENPNLIAHPILPFFYYRRRLLSYYLLKFSSVMRKYF